MAVPEVILGRWRGTTVSVTSCFGKAAGAGATGTAQKQAAVISVPGRPQNALVRGRFRVGLPHSGQTPPALPVRSYPQSRQSPFPRRSRRRSGPRMKVATGQAANRSRRIQSGIVSEPNACHSTAPYRLTLGLQRGVVESSWRATAIVSRDAHREPGGNASTNLCRNAPEIALPGNPEHSTEASPSTRAKPNTRTNPAGSGSFKAVG
jgi:hypothetical protein